MMPRCSRAFAIARSSPDGRNGGEDSGAERLGGSDAPAALGEPVPERSNEREDATTHGLDSDLPKQADRCLEPEDLGRRQGARLVGASAGHDLPPLGEKTLLLVGLDVPPAEERRRQSVARRVADVEEGAALLGEQPLVRVGGEHVDLRLRDVEREGAQTLNRVDDEENALRAAELAELVDREHEPVVEGDPGDGDDARSAVDLRGDVVEGRRARRGSWRLRYSTPCLSSSLHGRAFDGNSMSSPTTLSPAFHAKLRATRFSAQHVDGRNAICERSRRGNAATARRARSMPPYHLRQSAAPRSRMFSTCATIASETRRGRGATAAWLK